MHVPADDTGRRPEAALGPILYDETAINRRVAELGHEICVYYEEGELLLVGLLKGSFIFLADLVRNIPRSHRVDFCVVSSYGSGTNSSGIVRLLYEPDVAMEDYLIRNNGSPPSCRENESRLTVTSKADSFLVMVAGGAGKHSVYLETTRYVPVIKSVDDWR